MSEPEKSQESKSASVSRDLRRRAEALLSKPGSEIPSIPGDDIKALVHELQVHQMELEIQNEELREAQLELGETRDRYSDLYEFAPVGYLTLDSEGAILESNLRAATLLGVERANLVGAKFSDFVDRDHQDALFLHRRRVFSTDTVQTCELEVHRPDATIRDMRLESIAFRNRAITGVDQDCCRIALIDTTGEKEAEEWRKMALQVLKMVEHLPVGAIYLDGETLQMNRVAEEITGYAKEELPTLDQWFRTLYGSRHAEIRHDYEAHYKAGLPASDTGHLIRKNGEERIVEFAGHRFDDHAVWILNDVTERERAVEALRKSEEQNRAILNAAVDAIITIDREGTIISANPATERIFAYGRNELVGQNVSVLMPSPYREEHDGYLARYHETGNAKVIGIGREVIARRKDGSTFPADLAVSDMDVLGRYTGIIRDITRRKRTEDALRLEHDFNENLIETTQSIILVLDPDGRIIRFNSALERLTGWTLEEVEGRDWFTTFLPKANREQIRELFDRAIEGQPTIGNVNAILTKSGDERLIEWYDSPFHETNGNLIGLVCSGIDITERRILEEQICNASEEEKIRIARELHDGLGSRLTGIGLLTSALDGKLRRGEPVDADEADVILKNVREALNETRTLARGLHGIGGEPGGLAYALKGLAKQIRDTSGTRCRFVSEGGDCISFADAGAANHVFRIAQEALNNAVRHSGATHLTIRLGHRDDGRFVLSIKDNGCGFDPAKTGGDCLGMRTMDYRASAIGAQLDVSPRKGQGTAVTCLFTTD